MSTGRTYESHWEAQGSACIFRWEDLYPVILRDISHDGLEEEQAYTLGQDAQNFLIEAE